MNVAPYTVSRWENEEGSAPSGLQQEVLRALHNTAQRVRENEAERAMIGGLIALGIGALIFYLLANR